MAPQTSSEMNLPCSSQFITAIIHQLSTFHPEQQPTTTVASTSAPAAVHDIPSYYNSNNSTNNTPNNRLSNLPADSLAKVKPLLLTLHSLFPNELLLALDILDRKLVTEYIIQQEPDESKDNDDDDDDAVYMSERNDGCRVGVYFVQSRSVKTAPPARSHSNPHLEKSYEVCINSWNCTCPAFSLAAFRDIGLENSDDEESCPGNTAEKPQSQQQRQQPDGNHVRNDDELTKLHGTNLRAWVFGGRLTQNSSCSSPSSSSGCCFMHDTPPICKHLLACVLGSRCPELFGGGVEVIAVSAEELAARHAGWGG